jgi:hypothetical protein
LGSSFGRRCHVPNTQAETAMESGLPEGHQGLALVVGARDAGKRCVRSSQRPVQTWQSGGNRKLRGAVRGTQPPPHDRSLSLGAVDVFLTPTVRARV